MTRLRIFLLSFLMIFLIGTGVTYAVVYNLPQEMKSDADYVFRFWSDTFQGHFFTIDYDEATTVKNTDSNWGYEKVAFSAYKDEVDGSKPLYRFWSDVFHGHFYTSDYNEYVQVKDTDSNWNYEWIAYYVYPVDYEGAVDTELVYRFWSPVFLHHFYTADYNEMVRVRDTDSNWIYEGSAFRVPRGEDLINDEGHEVTYLVKDVIDGDTIKVEIGGKTESVRLIGIDAPETYECYASESTDKATLKMLGQLVTLEVDDSQGDRDKYDRLLRYVFLPDGSDYGLYAVKYGYAFEYTYSSQYKYQSEYRTAENWAENYGEGLWSPNTCNGGQDDSNNDSDYIEPVVGNFICNCSKTCSQMSSCAEAYYQLNACGCSTRDVDNDGVPCENIC